MPVRSGMAASGGPERPDLRSHDFAGASSWVLDIIGRYYADDPAVDQAAIALGMERADDMLRRAASLELEQQPGGVLRARVINESGHKLPTGHIEGRRAWVEVQVFDAGGGLLQAYGHYDAETAELDEAEALVVLGDAVARHVDVVDGAHLEHDFVYHGGRGALVDVANVDGRLLVLLPGRRGKIHC